MADGLFSGWYSKKNLCKWNEEDTRNLYKCEWIKTFDIKQDFKNKRERKKYFDELYDRLIQTLPSEDLKELNKRVERYSRISRRDRFEKTIIYTITSMRSKLCAHDYQKQKSYENKPYADYESTKEVSFNEFRANLIMQETRKNNLLNKNNSSENVQKEYTRPGYYPTMEILIKLPPIEIIDYVGFRLIKYDKFGGYYAIILRYPKDSYRNPEIMYNENAQVLESEAEYKFDQEVDKYLQSKANPYGDKTYNNVDISNIEQVMGGDNQNTVNPLDGDIF